jgi:hypothetical protein
MWLVTQVLSFFDTGDQVDPATSNTTTSTASQPQLPLAAVAVLASTLPTLQSALHGKEWHKAEVLKAAHLISQHAAHRLTRGSQASDSLPDAQAWAQLLQGLIESGLIPGSGGAHHWGSITPDHSSRPLHQLLDLSAQQLPALLSSQAADARSVSMLLSLYAKFDNGADLKPVVQVRAMHVMWFAVPVAFMHVICAC